jgi:hypothetical protein
MGEEQRAHPRREVSIETRLFLRGVLRSEVPTIIPCRIVDASESGARIELDVQHRLPPRVYLLRDEKESMYECRTVWQVGQAAGLVFVERCGWAKHDELLKELGTARILGDDDPFDLS